MSLASKSLRTAAYTLYTISGWSFIYSMLRSENMDGLPNGLMPIIAMSTGIMARACFMTADSKEDYSPYNSIVPTVLGVIFGQAVFFGGLYLAEQKRSEHAVLEQKAAPVMPGVATVGERLNLQQVTWKGRTMTVPAGCTFG